MSGSDSYFASDTANLLARCASRVEEAAGDFDFEHCRIAYEHLYGESLRLGAQDKVVRDGDQGELVKLRIARAKAIRESLVGLWLAAPISWKCTAKNSDAQNRSAVQGAQAVMDSEWRNGMQKFAAEWGKSGAAFRDAYAYPDWHMGAGEEVMADPSTGQTFFEGKLRVRHVPKWACLYDKNYQSWEELPWVAVCLPESAYALAALHGGPAERIEGEDDASYSARMNIRAGILGADSLLPKLTRNGRTTSKTRDVVMVWHLFHRPDAACREGLEFHFINGGVQLGEPKSCKRIPIKRFAPATREDCPEGDSQWQSVLGIEEMLNSTNSSVASNFNTCATQIIVTDSSTVIDHNDLTNLSMLKIPPGGVEPKGVNLTKNPEGYGDWAEALKQDSLDIVGLNDVAQGNPEGANMSGVALALLKGAATERNSNPQRELFTSVAGLGYEMLQLCAENMSEEQFLQVAGRSSALNIPQRKVSKSQLGLLTGVQVEIGNALEQSPAGRLQIFEYLLKLGAIKTPEDAQQVIETGQLPPSTDPARMQSLLIAYENQQIAEGITPPVHARQNHILHVQGHQPNCENPAILGDDAALQADQEHFDWHYREYWGLPDGVVPKTDPMYFDRVRVMLGQAAPSAVGPPPMGGEVPAGGAPSPVSEEGPSGPPNGAPPALQPPAPVEGQTPVPTTVPSA